jgi:hypothetical protein
MMDFEGDGGLSERKSVSCAVEFLPRRFVLVVRFALLEGSEQTLQCLVPLPVQSVQFFTCHLIYS